MGRWMEARENRDKCVIITKGAHPNNWRARVTDYDILADANDSLKKLKTDKLQSRKEVNTVLRIYKHP